MPLSELRERLEKASGGDLEIDALILCAVAAPPGSFVKQSPINGAWVVYEDVAIPKYGHVRVSWYRTDGWRLTESLDAIVSLIERKLPGWAYGFASPDDPENDPALQRQFFSGRLRKANVILRAHHPASPALALCLAFVKAMEAQANEDAKATP